LIDKLFDGYGLIIKQSNHPAIKPLLINAMSKKNKPDSRGFVYSTDPNFSFLQENSSIETLRPSQQKLKVRLDTKHRAGKAVTVIEGFMGKDEDLQELGRKLKSFCGTGALLKMERSLCRVTSGKK
jgi:translation initiation factor 1